MNKNVPAIIEEVAEVVKASEIAMTAEGVPVRVATDSLTECMSVVKKGSGKSISAAETRTLAEVQAARSVENMHKDKFGIIWQIVLFCEVGIMIKVFIFV